MIWVIRSRHYHSLYFTSIIDVDAYTQLPWLSITIRFQPLNRSIHNFNTGAISSHQAIKHPHNSSRRHPFLVLTLEPSPKSRWRGQVVCKLHGIICCPVLRPTFFKWGNDAWKLHSCTFSNPSSLYLSCPSTSVTRCLD